MTTVDLHLTPDEKAGIVEKGKSYVFKSRPAGRTGDTFFISDRRFEIVDVCERTLDAISRNYHVMDGCPTSADFIAHWKAAHNGEGDPGTRLYVHWFRDITSPAANDLV